MVVRVFAWSAVVFMATLVTIDAYALTLKSGQVLTKDGVVNAEDSPETKKALERDGFRVVAGKVILDVEGHTVSVDVTDLRGKSKQEQVELIGDAAIEQIGSDETFITSVDQLEGLGSVMS